MVVLSCPIFELTMCCAWHREAAKLTNIGKLLERRGKELLGSSYKDPISSFSDFQEFTVSNLEVLLCFACIICSLNFLFVNE